MAIAKTENLTIHYDDAGDGDPLLFIHGHPFDRSMWREQVSLFSRRGYRVIAPDLRGYGSTPLPEGPAGFEVFAQDLAQLLDHLGIDRVVVCGLSMGGQIAMDFCRQFPSRVRALALMATFPQAETAQGKVARNAIADRLEREGVKDYAVELLPKMLAASTIEQQPAVAAGLLRLMGSSNASGCAAALRARAERLDFAETLAGLRVPSLVVVGDQDAFTTRADAERMHELLHDSKLIWMEDVGHMPNLESLASFDEAFRQFLQSVCQSEAAQ
ncbi:alpha/beta fold hydrolase [Trinickia acidisoli]|uniref:alpha/beta fold hydrolase n=1 Tax=Trinickia acidisoli TaxID=2767482 RepID=UPI001A8FBA6F|nr:alpha/beta fold hydrolase [Trinickia acidisoli]